MNFLVSQIRFHDVIDQSTVHMYSFAKLLKHGRPTWPNEYVLDPYFSIQCAGFSYVIKQMLHSLTLVIKFYQTRPEKMLLSLPKARLITLFQDSFNKILSQQLTHDRSYIIT